MEIPAGTQREIDLSFNALQGMRVGKHGVEVRIHSNDPEHPLTSLKLELEILNTAPEITGSLKNIETALGNQDIQIDLAPLFKDVNAEDQTRYFVQSENDREEALTAANILNLHAVKGGRC